MGICNCKDSKLEVLSNVEVTKLKQRTVSTTRCIGERPANILTVKSIRYANPNKFQSAQQVSEFLNKEETVKESMKDIERYKEDEYNMIIEHEIDALEEEKIKKALNNHFLFKDMTEELLKIVVQDLIEFRLEAEQTLFREGEEGNFFYILKSGTLELTINGNKKKLINEWECFGELALLQKCRRTGTVKCLTDAKVYLLDGTVFRDLIKKINMVRLQDRYSFIEMIPIMKYLNQVQKTNLAESINLVEYFDREKIINEGDSGDNMYIIKEGIVSCRIKNKEIRRLYTKDFFGQNAIFTEGKRTLDVISFGRSVCYEFTRKAFIDSLGENYREIILNSIFLNIMTNNSFFSEMFIESQLINLYKSFVLKSYKQNQIVFPKEAQNNKKIIIIIEGNIINVKFYKFSQVQIKHLRLVEKFMEKK
jgi:cGMP-dependent protein kinase